jgi:hypothetical protein
MTQKPEGDCQRENAEYGNTKTIFWENDRNKVICAGVPHVPHDMKQ